jgi:hypothetical protein
MSQDDNVVLLETPANSAVPAPVQIDTSEETEPGEAKRPSNDGKLPVGALAENLDSRAPTPTDPLAALKAAVEALPVANDTLATPAPEITVPPRDPIVLPTERPRARKLRWVAGACAVLLVGGLVGTNTQSMDVATTKAWMHQSASVLNSAFWSVEKELRDGIEQWTRSETPIQVASQAASPEPASHTDTLERSVEALKTKLDQMQLSSEGLTEDLRAEVDRYRATVERNQAELTSKLTQLLERVERIEQQRGAAPVAAVGPKPEQVAAVAPPVPPPSPIQRSAPQVDSKPTPTSSSAPQELRREPSVVKQWTVREVLNGMALLDGPRGLIGVSPGQTVPGVGRVESIVRQGGRWIVATSSGVITGR